MAEPAGPQKRLGNLGLLERGTEHDPESVESAIRAFQVKNGLPSSAVGTQGGGGRSRASKDGLKLSSDGAAQLVSKNLVMKTQDASLSMASEVKLDGKRILLNAPDKVQDEPKELKPPTRIELARSSRPRRGRPLIASVVLRGICKLVLTVRSGEPVHIDAKLDRPAAAIDLHEIIAARIDKSAAEGAENGAVALPNGSSRARLPRPSGQRSFFSWRPQPTCGLLKACPSRPTSTRCTALLSVIVCISGTSLTSALRHGIR